MGKSNRESCLIVIERVQKMHLQRCRCVKTRPEYSQGGAARALVIYQKPPGFLTELPEFLLGTLRCGDELLGEVQAEHFHEALSVDPVMVVADQNGEGTGGGKIHKILNVLNRTQPYLEFPHKKSSRTVQKYVYRV